MSNKFETKKLFWKIVDTITTNKEIWVKNNEKEIIEEGMVLPSGASVTFGLESGALTIYDKNMNAVYRFKEDNHIVVIFKELLEQVEEA
ncbi:hypothetical protein ACQPUY_09230 [Clostridium nigeriense]|uniref:hypothetical protein n=1 Tax=Clostridium nigeriense TaxID=1805470 RepID=UPI003D331A6C